MSVGTLHLEVYEAVLDESVARSSDGGSRTFVLMQLGEKIRKTKMGEQGEGVVSWNEICEFRIWDMPEEKLRLSMITKSATGEEEIVGATEIFFRRHAPDGEEVESWCPMRRPNENSMSGWMRIKCRYIPTFPHASETQASGTFGRSTMSKKLKQSFQAGVLQTDTSAPAPATPRGLATESLDAKKQTSLLGGLVSFFKKSTTTKSPGTQHSDGPLPAGEWESLPSPRTLEAVKRKSSSGMGMGGFSSLRGMMNIRSSSSSRSLRNSLSGLSGSDSAPSSPRSSGATTPRGTSVFPGVPASPRSSGSATARYDQPATPHSASSAAVPPSPGSSGGPIASAVPAPGSGGNMPSTPRSSVSASTPRGLMTARDGSDAAIDGSLTARSTTASWGRRLPRNFESLILTASNRPRDDPTWDEGDPISPPASMRVKQSDEVSSSIAATPRAQTAKHSAPAAAPQGSEQGPGSSGGLGTGTGKEGRMLSMPMEDMTRTLTAGTSPEMKEIVESLSSIAKNSKKKRGALPAMFPGAGADEKDAPAAPSSSKDKDAAAADDSDVSGASKATVEPEADVPKPKEADAGAAGEPEPTDAIEVGIAEVITKLQASAPFRAAEEKGSAPAPVASATCAWEYKWVDDGDLYGPFATKQMWDWFQKGFFSGEHVALVRCVEASGPGPFQSSTDKEFETVLEMRARAMGL